MNINLYENKSGHYEHIYFIIKLYEIKAGHYKHIYIQYTYIVGKYNIFVRALETGRIASLRRAFQACFAASTNEFYI